LEYGKFANSEYKYRSAVVAKICKRLPPILRWNTDHIQGYERLCKVRWRYLLCFLLCIILSVSYMIILLL
jgi:hypothetical protein